MPIARKLRSFHSLTRDRRLLVAQALGISVFVQLSFGVIGVSRTQALLRWWAFAGKRPSRPADPASLIKAARAAQAALKRNFRLEGSCLARSLTLWALLLRRGLATDLRIGMRKRQGKTEGHAWLEFEGRPLNESPDVIDTYELHATPVAFDSGTRKR